MAHAYVSNASSNMRAYSIANKIFRFFKLSMKVMGIWPDRDESWITSFAYSVLWWFYFINNMMLLLPTLWTITQLLDDISLAMTPIIEATAILESIILLVLFKTQKRRLKALLYAVKNHLNSEEFKRPIDINLSYVRLFILMLVFYIILMYVHVRMTPYSPGGRILVSAKYPFPIDSANLKIFLLCNQCFVIFHLATVIIADTFVVLVMYTSAVRLQILKIDWRNIRSDDKFGGYIEKHQDILLTIRETNQIVGIVVFKTVICFMLYCICGGIQIIDGLTVKSIPQFLLLSFVYLRISISSECSEEMLSVNNDLQYDLFTSLWHVQSHKIVAAKLPIIHRCQHFPRVHIGGFMPSLGRHYLAQLLYTTFSYFMTIRAIVNK